MDLKDFIRSKLAYYSSHFKRNAVLLEQNGEPLYKIDLSFSNISDQFITNFDNAESQLESDKTATLSLQQLNQQLLKINDEDLMALWDHLTGSYEQAFNIEDQNIGDLTLLKLAELYASGKCRLNKLKFANNTRITQIGAISLGNSLKMSQVSSCITALDFHGISLSTNGANRIIELIVCCCNLKSLDLGLIGNSSLKYLAQILSNPHNLLSIGFGEDSADPWNQTGLKAFQEVIRRNQNSKKILSINFYPEKIVKYWDLIHQLNILCQKRRALKVNQRQNQFKAAALNPDHNKFYDPENHGQNAYKFSVKSYLTNVFGSELDEALYFLEKERRNSIREEAIFQITRQPINKLILQDICTADGSILVLAKYLLGKIRQKKL